MPRDDPFQLFGTTMALTSVDFCMPRSVISFQTISSRLGNALSFGPSFRNSVRRDRRFITVLRHTLDGTFGQMRPSRTCCLGKGMSERMPSAQLLLRRVSCVFNVYVNCSHVQLPTVVLSMIDSDFSQALHSRAMLGMHVICCMIIQYTFLYISTYLPWTSQLSVCASVGAAAILWLREDPQGTMLCDSKMNSAINGGFEHQDGTMLCHTTPVTHCMNHKGQGVQGIDISHGAHTTAEKAGEVHRQVRRQDGSGCFGSRFRVLFTLFTIVYC